MTLAFIILLLMGLLLCLWVSASIHWSRMKNMRKGGTPADFIAEFHGTGISSQALGWTYEDVLRLSTIHPQRHDLSRVHSLIPDDVEAALSDRIHLLGLSPTSDTSLLLDQDVNSVEDYARYIERAISLAKIKGGGPQQHI
jgi:hypothetical protein